MMATNLKYEDELRSILADIARHRFTNSRQINPQSNLFLSLKRAIDEGLVKDAILDESYSSTLAEMNLKNAHLTDAGQQKLQQLMNQQ